MNSQDFRNLQEAYLSVYDNELSEDYMDEGTAGDVAARAEKLAAQRKGQTPERKQMYASLAYKASERERGPRNTDWQRKGLTQKQRNSRREIDVEYSDETGLKNSTPGPGTITKNKRKLAAQKARGQHAECYDLYDIILSHLLDEGYAETLEEAEWLMANVIDEEAIEIITELTGGKGHPGYKAGSKDRGPMQSGHSADSERRKDKGGTMSQRHGYHLGDIDDNDDDEDGLETIVKQQSRDSRANVRKPLRNKVQAARKVLSKEQYVDEAQEARNNPEKYEAGQQKKSAPVRGERTPMPPRGDKRREDFEKWYAANVR